jgi:hypothetical protein
MTGLPSIWPAWLSVMPVTANISMPTSVAAPVIQCQMRACVIQNRRRTLALWAFFAAFSAAAFSGLRRRGRSHVRPLGHPDP